MYSLVSHKNWKHLWVDSIHTYMNVVHFFFYSFYRHSTTKERRRKITSNCRNYSFFRELPSSKGWSRKIRNLTVHDKMPRNLDWNHWKEDPFMCNYHSAQLSKIYVSSCTTTFWLMFCMTHGCNTCSVLQASAIKLFSLLDLIKTQEVIPQSRGSRRIWAVEEP